MTGTSASTDLPPFAGLDPAHRLLLIRSGTDVTYDAGVRLFEEGGPADSCWLIRRGRIALDTSVPGRGQVVIQTLAPGDVVGWSWFVPPHRWHFGARAVEPVHAIALDTAQLLALADQDPRFGYALARQLFAILLERMQSTRARLLDLYGNPHAK